MRPLRSLLIMPANRADMLAKFYGERLALSALEIAALKSEGVI